MRTGGRDDEKVLPSMEVDSNEPGEGLPACLTGSLP